MLVEPTISLDARGEEQMVTASEKQKTPALLSAGPGVMSLEPSLHVLGAEQGVCRLPWKKQPFKESVLLITLVASPHSQWPESEQALISLHSGPLVPFPTQRWGEMGRRRETGKYAAVEKDRGWDILAPSGWGSWRLRECKVTRGDKVWTKYYQEGVTLGGPKNRCEPLWETEARVLCEKTGIISISDGNESFPGV